MRPLLFFGYQRTRTSSLPGGANISQPTAEPWGRTYAETGWRAETRLRPTGYAEPAMPPWVTHTLIQAFLTGLDSVPPLGTSPPAGAEAPLLSNRPYRTAAQCALNGAVGRFHPFGANTLRGLSIHPYGRRVY